MKDKSSGLLNIIFICFVLNIIPIALLGVFKISNGLYTLLYALFYCIQSFLLFFKNWKHIRYIPKKNFLILVLFLLNNIMALIYSYFKFGAVDYNEYLFIISSTINILLFILSLEKVTVSNNELIVFLKKICFIGLFAAILNILLNYKSIINLRFINNSYSVSFSSFFPNRNQFGLFMLIEIIALSLLSAYNYKKKYFIYFVIFGLNLILTMSRNSILGLAVYISMCIYYKFLKYKIKMSRNKLLLFAGICIFTIYIGIKVAGSEKIIGMINTMFIRIDTLETGSGRFSVWKHGINIANKYNFLFGVGRYKALELNKLLFNDNLEYFHSLYIEKYATNGLIGLLILFYLIKYVWKKVSNCSNLKYKIILKSTLISFYVFSVFETTTRFSIGYADSVFLIFFFTIPILISNIKYEKTNNIIKDKQKNHNIITSHIVHTIK